MRVALMMAQEKIMKTIKKTAFWTTSMIAALFVVMGSFNSPVLDRTSFLKNDLNIQFAKRLDEVNGNIVEGRMAASIGNTFKWKSLSKSLIKPTSIKEATAKVLKAQNKKVEKAAIEEVAKTETKERPTAAITKDLSLTLTGGLYNKKALSDASQFSGSIRAANGVIEGIEVSLPDGREIDINTSNDEMNGNVFAYDDTETGEEKNGLLYKVKEGVYMVTLTNDSQYPGLRLEFKTDEEVELSIANEESNWGLNDQNNENYEGVEQARNDSYNQDSYAQDNYDNEYQDEQEDFGQDAEQAWNDEAPAQTFNFNS